MDDDLTHYMKATGRLASRVRLLRRAYHELHRDRAFFRRHMQDADAEIERLRVVVTAAIRRVEQEQFRGNGSEVLTEVYRILCDESIATQPNPPVGQPDEYLDPDPEMHTSRELLAKVEELVTRHLRLRAAIEQALDLGEDEGMRRGKMPYPDWWIVLDRALDERWQQEAT